ncbi:MAG: hypothetical protein JST11_01310 [Acidobacteria bacterium]|nr:hypothetical protein [Acidobacteriota bacterium]
MIPFLLLAFSVPTYSTAPRASAPLPKALSACMALPRADVESALGRKLNPPEESNAARTSTCDYSADHALVTVTLTRLAGEVNLPSEIAALQREIEGSSSRPAPGFGATAFFLDVPGGGTQLHLIHGNDYVMVSVLGFGDAAAVAPAAERMMRSALGRL